MAVEIPFNRDSDFTPGKADPVSPLVRRVLAPNPGPFTFKGTNTYIIGHGEVAVIDPGPAIDSHLEAICAAVTGETVTHILVTHTHIDHSPLAAPLKARTGAKTVGFSRHGSGKRDDRVRVEEGGDTDFVPDIAGADGTRMTGPGWTLACVHTPGHTSNHLCFALEEENALFTGDHVMSWSTSVVVPPDGDMAQYMASLDKVLARDAAVLWPAHGGAVRQPRPFLEAFIAHRDDREKEITACIADGITSIPAMVARMYAAVDPRLHPAAQLSVLAHTIRMVNDGRLRCTKAPSLQASYRLP